jgi:polysaccharide export outer membrane protein
MKLIKINLILFSLIYFCLSSCVKPKDVIYFSTDKFDSTKNLAQHFDIKIQKNDILDVQISSLNQKANELFKTDEMTVSSFVNYSSGIPVKGGYLVDKSGKITLPFIGQFTVDGRYRNDVINDITSKLEEYLIDPIVSISITNFKITVIGEVKTPGTFSIPNEKFNIIQAIGIANDLTLSGNRKKIILIREENNLRKEFEIDLTKKDLFDSDYFYVRQNDIIYVPPSINRLTNTNTQVAVPFVAFASLILTAINIFSK